MPGKRLVLSQSLCLRTTMTKAMAISRTRKQIPRVSHEPDDEEPGIPPDEENPEGMLIPSGGLKDYQTATRSFGATYIPSPSEIP